MNLNIPISDKVNDDLIIKVVDGLVYVNINKLEEINGKENI